MKQVIDAIFAGRSVILVGPDGSGRMAIARKAFKAVGIEYLVLDPLMSSKRYGLKTKAAILQSADLFGKKLFQIATKDRLCIALSTDPKFKAGAFDVITVKMPALPPGEARNLHEAEIEEKWGGGFVRGVKSDPLTSVFEGRGGDVDRFHFPRNAAFNVPQVYIRWDEMKQAINLLANADKFHDLSCYRVAMESMPEANARPMYKRMVKT